MPTLFTILIPAYNEAVALPGVLAELQEFMKSRPCEIIVVDDGSSDGTAELVRAPIKLIRHATNQGHGVAIKSGLAVAASPVVVVFDADGQHRASDITPLLGMIEEGTDLAIGARRNLIDQRRGVGNFLISGFAGFIAGRPIPDLTSGLRAFRKEIADRFLNLYPNRFCFELTSTMAFIFAGCRVEFRDIDPVPRTTGRSKIKASLDGIRFGFRILYLKALFQPVKFFGACSLPFLALGSWGASVGRTPPAVNGLAVGILLLLIGFVRYFYKPWRMGGRLKTI